MVSKNGIAEIPFAGAATTKDQATGKTTERNKEWTRQKERELLFHDFHTWCCKLNTLDASNNVLFN